jgi:hypothetical protein
MARSLAKTPTWVSGPTLDREGAAMRKTAKKLTLNAETLKNLDASNLQDALGGATFRPPCTATNLCSGCKPCF